MSMEFKNKEMTDDIEYVSEVYGTPDSPNPEEAEMIGHGEIVSDVYEIERLGTWITNPM